ncbi:hypothetical protein KSP35_05930 [Aquihabitans sp. G128]|uniref:hypothetical protein n=1 Tax=Aquihabitans sp. G128 TaxID=2849779 RepID=UPI001C240D28|nr:hypothetical protein [Aquihabitans sp. G128]QXC62344.1 hypothetical protein KSP35_05930 [Aquihabitans sp. G128]
MSQDQPTTTSRRNLLLAGTVGAGATFFLAACGKKDGPPAGLSGTPASSTSSPPTVPTTVPSATAVENDAIQLRTLRSIELLVARVYAGNSSQISDPELSAAVKRFGSAHASAAKLLTDAIDERDKDDIVDDATANEYLSENLVKPRVAQFTDDASILDFFHDLESALTATYINAVGIFTTAEWRQQAMLLAAADARRVTILADGGKGAIPEDPLYPGTDLVPGDAFLGPKKAQAEGS